MSLTESTIEFTALSWLEALGYTVVQGPEIAPGGEAAERSGFGEVILKERLRKAIARINPEIPEEAREEALRKVLRMATPSLVGTNRTFHQMLRDGVEIEYRRKDGTIAGDRVFLADFAVPEGNDWLAVNQFRVEEGSHRRRPDIVILLNGLPLAVIELKNPADEQATLHGAYQQLQTYKTEIPSLFQTNALLIVSDGVKARIGSLTANWEWFKVWRTIDGHREAASGTLELEVLVQGVFDKRRFLDFLRHFIVFEEDAETGRTHKILAGYHQFHAVNAAVEETVRASGMATRANTLREEGPETGRSWAGQAHGGEAGDRRVGVVWHTQGSGKSFSMLFYAGRVIAHPAMGNPTLVVLTDRNDLDDQLFSQFQRCQELLRQKPIQATDREHLRNLLRVASGGVVFTTIQKFLPAKGEKMPELSPRQNIVVIADEAHRSQYDLIEGLARNMRDALPNASFIGFTGTPIEKSDANTRAVFGDYISIYDIQRAVADGATVPIYYESRIVKLGLNEAKVDSLDAAFEEATEEADEETQRKLKTKWAALEALVGNPDRIKVVAEDLVRHFERRSEGLDGKAMIVCMSRRICVAVYEALIALRPEWASAPDDSLTIEEKKSCVAKVIMTGAAEDGPTWQPHIRSKEGRKAMAARFKDPKDPFRIVIVRDMWLTGFDAPCLHTMYIDKPMRGHGLMQAIARVNRVFSDKPGGLVVDYLGLADQLKAALLTYTENGGKGSPSLEIDQAIAVLKREYSVCTALFHGFDWSAWRTGDGLRQTQLLAAAMEHVLEKEGGKRRLADAVVALSRAFALCAASPEAEAIRDDIGFFQAVKASLGKAHGEGGKSAEGDLDAAVRQLVSGAIVAGEGVIDVFTAAGLKKPDISILSDQFLEEVRGLKFRHVAAELLERLLKGEVRALFRENVIQAELFSERLQKALNAYHNRAIATQEIIEELIAMAKQLQRLQERGKELGLNREEVAFYDALARNHSAIEVLGNDCLKVIAAELVTKVRQNATIDWNQRESAQAKMRVIVKRILRHYGYPPDLQEEAVKQILRQAETLCAEVA